jgi:hypothetical protein
MMKTTTLFLAFFTSILCASEMTYPNPDAITEKNLKAHLEFLSHDLLEGRGTGTRGYDLAALYVATQFEMVGLKPGLPNGSYLQPVPLRKSNVVPEQCKFTIHSNGSSTDLDYAVDYLMYGDYLREDTAVQADVVFAGFGVTAPGLNHDDYAGIDAKGKIVLLISSAPENFPISERAHYASGRTKEKNAVAHGAVGILTFRNPVDLQRSSWERSVRSNKLPGYRWMESAETPHDVPAQIQADASLSEAGARILFSHSSVPYDEIMASWKNGKLKSFPLGFQVNLRTVSKHEKASSPNVVGLLEGSDPQRKNEYVLYTAHLDHLGISEPVNNDRINNGAYDNATGIASLIEMARAFTRLKQKPLRSVLFVAVTAEEKGLQGADYFAHNPTVPIESIVANINTDMFLMLYPFADAVALGAEHSSLGPISDRAFQAVGLKRVPDPAPEEVRFVRSDQYAFIRKGIPAIKLMAGFESLDPSIDGADATRKWLRTTYHSPQDENSQKMHWESGIKIVQATFLIGYEAANTPARPAWNKDDFFGRMFAAR